MTDLRILSLGAGVQSTTLALMIELGEVPMVDCAIFADTMGEPKKVYEHLDWLKSKLSYPLHDRLVHFVHIIVMMNGEKLKSIKRNGMKLLL